MVTCSLIDIFLATNDWLKTMQNYCRQESNTEKLLQRVVLAEAMKKKAIDDSMFDRTPKNSTDLWFMMMA